MHFNSIKILNTHQKQIDADNTVEEWRNHTSFRKFRPHPCHVLTYASISIRRWLRRRWRTLKLQRSGIRDSSSSSFVRLTVVTTISCNLRHDKCLTPRKKDRNSTKAFVSPLAQSIHEDKQHAHVSSRNILYKVWSSLRLDTCLVLSKCARRGGNVSTWNHRRIEKCQPSAPSIHLIVDELTSYVIRPIRSSDEVWSIHSRRFP